MLKPPNFANYKLQDLKVSIRFTREGVLKRPVELLQRGQGYVSIRFTREGVLKLNRPQLVASFAEVSIRFTREGVLKLPDEIRQ